MIVDCVSAGGRVRSKALGMDIVASCERHAVTAVWAPVR